MTGRVLIVDDRPDLRDLLAFRLQRLRIQVFTADVRGRRLRVAVREAAHRRLTAKSSGGRPEPEP